MKMEIYKILEKMEVEVSNTAWWVKGYRVKWLSKFRVAEVHKFLLKQYSLNIHCTCLTYKVYKETERLLKSESGLELINSSTGLLGTEFVSHNYSAKPTQRGFTFVYGENNY